MQFILWMDKSEIAKDGVDVFFPKPCTIKEDAANFIIALTILHLLHPQDLEAQRLEWAVLSIVRMSLHTKVLTDDIASLAFVV